MNSLVPAPGRAALNAAGAPERVTGRSRAQRHSGDSDGVRAGGQARALGRWQRARWQLRSPSPPCRQELGKDLCLQGPYEN